MKKQPPDVFYKKTIFKNFAIFTEKHLCWSLSQHGRFPVNIAKFLETPILENIRESMFVGCEGGGGGGGGGGVESLGALDLALAPFECFALFTYQKNFFNETIILFLKQP